MYARFLVAPPQCRTRCRGPPGAAAGASWNCRRELASRVEAHADQPEWAPATMRGQFGILRL